MTTILTTPERITALKEALDNADPAVRFNAALDLVKQGNVTGIPTLIEAFTHESGSVRLFHASKALVQLGQPAVPALTAALQSDHPQVRIDAACTLYQIASTQFNRLLPLLTEALQSADPKVMSDALHFLSVVHEQERKAAVPALLQALQSTTPAADSEGWVTDVRTSVAILLAQSGAPVELIVPALVAALRDKLAAVRWGAACALAELGPAAQAAVPTLAQVIGDEAEAEAVRVEAAYALAVIGDPRHDTLPVLLNATQSDDWWVRAFAARLLGELAATPVARPPATIFDPITRALMGMRALPHLAEPAPALVTTLVHLLTDPNYNVRRNAIAALAKLAHKATVALPGLLAALRQPDVAPLAAEALANMGSAAVPSLEQILTTADDTVIDDPVMSYAAYALRLIKETGASQAKPAAQPSPVCHSNPYRTIFTAKCR